MSVWLIFHGMVSAMSFISQFMLALVTSRPSFSNWRLDTPSSNIFLGASSFICCEKAFVIFSFLLPDVIVALVCVVLVFEAEGGVEVLVESVVRPLHGGLFGLWTPS